MVDQWKKIERYAYLGIAVSLIILVAVSSISYQSLIKIQDDFDWIVSSREMLLNLSYFLSSLKDAEMEQRGFLLTGQEHHLEPYKYIEKGVKAHFKNLRAIAGDKIAQQIKIAKCEKLIAEKLRELQKTMLLQKNKSPESDKDMIFTKTGKRIIGEMQTLVLKMDKDERTLLDQRSKSIEARIKLDAVAKTAVMIILLVTAILIISRVSYLFRIYKKAVTKQIELADIKSDFVSNVSHELRTPLKAIRESISIVLDESAGHVNDEQKKFLIVSKRNVDRLDRLINEVLDFQKLNAGKTKLHIRNNNMNKVIEEVHELMIPLAKEKGLSLTMKLGSQLPEVEFDRDKIIQVLTNIVNNAIKFTEEDAVTITTSIKENALYVSVQDNGPGIAEDDLFKIFNRFEQASDNKNKKNDGVGLGPSTSKDIIQLHNGKIWVESELGKGTTIWFLLPVKERRKC